MAVAKKDAAVQQSATALRDMKQADRTNLLLEKRTDLLEAKRSLVAQELANPRKVKALRREIALIMTVENENPGEKEEKK